MMVPNIITVTTKITTELIGNTLIIKFYLTRDMEQFRSPVKSLPVRTVLADLLVGVTTAEHLTAEFGLTEAL